uniref:Uncharacterized protein MANES_02G058900 n=1 Tax=Rhizophora mucronata TaxID=61149 RepID=A0A2P2JZN0_RHIMU
MGCLVVLYLIVCPARQASGNSCLFA